MTGKCRKGAVFNPSQCLETVTAADGPRFLVDYGLGGTAKLGVIRLQADGRENMWERHPQGDELLIILAGRLTMTMKSEGCEGGLADYPLGPGDVLFVPRGVPHAAEFHTEEVQILFLSPVQGTEVWREVVARVG